MTAVRFDVEATPAGLRERLFLHETLTPAYPDYSRKNSVEAMWLIRQVIANRVTFPRAFGLHAPETEARLITDPNQFPGFEGYPNLSVTAMRNVYEVERLANSPRDRRHQLYLDHLTDAIMVATAPSVPTNMLVPGIAAWKTLGTPTPGKRFKYYKTLQRTDFYTTELR